MKKFSKAFLSIALAFALIFPLALLSGCDLFDPDKYKTEDEQEIESIKSITGIKTEFIEGTPLNECLDQTTSVVVRYNNNEKETVKISDLKITKLDTTVIGQKTMIVEYNNIVYTLPYKVIYKSIYPNPEKDLPSTIRFGQNLDLYNYSFFAETYNSVKTISYNDSSVKITNLKSNEISVEDKTATIECGGKTMSYLYKVWWTDYDKTYDEKKEISIYTLNLNNFKFKTDGVVTGNITIKIDGETENVTLSTWSYNEVSKYVEIKDIHSKVVIKYSPSDAYMYILGGTFDGVNFDISLCLA